MPKLTTIVPRPARPSMEVQERRRDERASIRVPVQVRVASLDAAVSSEAIDISRSGMFIAMEAPPAVGTQIDVDVSLQDGTLLLHATAEVVRTQRTQAPFGAGVRFLDVSYEAQALIERMVADERLFGNYRLQSLIGRGGMAEIYLAIALEGELTGRRLAIKRIRPELGKEPRIIELFLREAQVTRLLEHPNIVEVLDIGRVGDTYYIAMAYVEGVNLAQIIEACSSRGIYMPLDFACYVARTVAGALDYAHRACDAEGRPLGIVHRDVTPSNIFVSSMGEILLGDFGVAHIAAISPPGEERVIVGKRRYRAPEQVLGRPVSPATDVFAMGAILYEMLANRPPFIGPDSDVIEKRILDGRVDPISSARADVPEALERLVLKALAPRSKPRSPWRRLTHGRQARPLRHADAASFGLELEPLYDHRVGNQTAIAAVVHNLFQQPLQPAAQEPNKTHPRSNS